VKTLPLLLVRLKKAEVSSLPVSVPFLKGLGLIAAVSHNSQLQDIPAILQQILVLD